MRMKQGTTTSDFFSLHFFDQLPPLGLWKVSKAAERAPETPSSTASPAPPPVALTTPSSSSALTPSSSSYASTGSSLSAGASSWLDNVDKMKEFAEFGLPLGGNPFLIVREGYIVSFDWRTRNAHWVFQHVRGNSSTQVAERKNIFFQEDPSIPEHFRPLLSDYRGSGYDRGHLAPAADMRHSENAMLESFYLTNVSPQVGEGFNRDYWARFEKFTRDLSKRFGSVQIITGPLFMPERHPTQSGKHEVRYEVLGNPANVAVPTHFFKAVLVEEKPPRNKTPLPVASSSDVVPVNNKNNSNDNDTRRFLIAGFILPNAAIPQGDPIQKYMVPINHIEKAAGLLLWPDLPQQVKYNLSYKPPAIDAPSTLVTTAAALPAAPDSSTTNPPSNAIVSTATSRELQAAATKSIQAFNLCMSPEQLCKLPPPNWFLKTDNNSSSTGTKPTATTTTTTTTTTTATNTKQ